MEQVWQLSLASHVPSPQLTGHDPQSFAQFLQVSLGASHLPSPQVGGHLPQSEGQEVQVSLESHFPLPQVWVQSVGQV